MPLQSTSGAASYDAFGGGTVAQVNYIEDFFQSYLRTGTGASATVTTGLDGSTKETLVWTKSRSAATAHKLTDNVRGATKALSSNTTSAEATDSQGLTAFSATGYTIGTNTDYNNSGATYVDWQWVSQPKFFDVLTYTGNGTNRTIAHNLGSVPGCIIIKDASAVSNWYVYHRSLATNQALKLNSTAAIETSTTFWNNTAATSSVFSLGTAGDVNGNGDSFVAYVFAHDAGGFGLTGTDNVISCGSFTTDGSGNADVNLGYEPQWVLIKPTNEVNSWVIVDTMRGYSLGAGNAGEDARLRPNTSDAESTSSNVGYPTATGFYVAGSGSMQHIYIAIRRGPMKVPTVGTSVFSPVTYAGNGSIPRTIPTGFVTDMTIGTNRFNDPTVGNLVEDRLQGQGFLYASQTSAFTAGTYAESFAVQNGFILNNSGGTGWNFSGYDYIRWAFKRAPSFFDEVCYTGNGTFDGSYNVNHNLGAVPEFIIAKRRDSTNNWNCYHSGLTSATYQIRLNLTAGQQNTGQSWGPTSTTFKPQYAGNADNSSNQSGGTYVAYLFATCAGVSKVGSYTGNGSTQTIDCGFTGGARFVLIKRIDDNGDWMVSDSARGIVSGNDPYLELNNTNAEVTGEDWLDTNSTGFVVNEVSGSNANTSSATYIFLAIA